MRVLLTGSSGFIGQYVTAELENRGHDVVGFDLVNGQDAEHLRLFTYNFDSHQVHLVFDKEDFHRARGKDKSVNFLYADGHIKNLLEIAGPP